jgi:hypothetical protein
VDDLLIDHPYAAGRHGPHRQLLMTGHAKLAHHEDIERRTERRRDFGGDRDAAAGQRQYYDITAAGQRLQTSRQSVPRVLTVGK